MALSLEKKFYVGCGLVSPRYIVKLKKQCAIASSEHGELSFFLKKILFPTERTARIRKRERKKFIRENSRDESR